MRGVLEQGLLVSVDYAQVQTWRQWQRQGLVASEGRSVGGPQVGRSAEVVDRAQVQTWQQWLWRSQVAREGHWMQRSWLGGLLEVRLHVGGHRSRGTQTQGPMVWRRGRREWQRGAARSARTWRMLSHRRSRCTFSSTVGGRQVTWPGRFCIVQSLQSHL